jgi:tetratricopeptide (TPR) repeat protein
MFLTIVSGAVQPGQEALSAADQQLQLERVVAYDDFQRKLVQWDQLLAFEYQRRGEGELAEEKMRSAEKRYAEILSKYESFLSEFANNAAAHNYYGEALADLRGEEAKAVEEWLKAVELDPQLPDPHNNLGIHYGHFGEPEKAIEEFRKAVELDPNVAEFHFNLGLALHNFRYVAADKYGLSLRQLFEEILKESRRARDLEPQDLEIAMDYARTFFSAENFEATPDWQEALAAWEYCLALAERPDARFSILLNMGRVALRMDRKEEASRYFREAQSIRPDSTVIERLLKQAK